MSGNKLLTPDEAVKGMIALMKAHKIPPKDWAKVLAGLMYGPL